MPMYAMQPLVAAQPVTIADAASMGILRFDRTGQIVAFEEKPKPDRLAEVTITLRGRGTPRRGSCRAV